MLQLFLVKWFRSLRYILNIKTKNIDDQYIVREGKKGRVNLHMLDIGYAFAFIENRKMFIEESDTRRLYFYNDMVLCDTFSNPRGKEIYLERLPK